MRLLAAFLVFIASLPAFGAAAPNADAASAHALLTTYEQLRERLAKSPFKQPIHLTAAEADHQVKGDIHAVLAHPFAESSRALTEAAQWCEILLLPFNTKHCETGGTSDRPSLAVLVGRKYTTPVEKAHRLDLRFAVASRTRDYLRVTLTAPEGPFGTRDYAIVLELAPLDEGRRSFMHLSYSYGYGNLASAAMGAYLSTVGAHKVGFTVEGAGEDGNPSLVRGMRGVMERNTMRYYLAIEAYLKAMRLSPAARVDAMIEEWFKSVERYPRQLHEIDREEYVSMKRREFARMHAGVSPVPRTASSSP